MIKKIVILAFYLVLFSSIACKDKQISKKITSEYNDYSLTLIRGAFHDDTFVMTLDSLKYKPIADANFEDKKYNQESAIQLDSVKVLEFFNEIDNKGFWQLKNVYTSESSCTSALTIILSVNSHIKKIACDDFERNCPEILKYIEEKIVLFEGRNLKRIYLPG